ncbi:hypothetical protein [Evansella clarkii]|uniref:hypothetical protein n=1 Tax=Evansella clarkii TaxID=79879 RepID=UPI000B444F4F|nr:hypothetical protein [Evansella clarkii]
MTDSTGKGKYVSVLHLRYLASIFGIIIIALLSFYYFGENATVSLSNAATAISAVLAVIAIVITLNDVAGQRNTVLELKETADKMEKALANANKQLTEINGVREQLINSMDSVFESNESLKKEVIQSLQTLVSQDKETIPREEFSSKLDEIKDYFDQNQVRHFINNKDALEEKKIKELKLIITELLINKGELTAGDLRLLIEKDYPEVSAKELAYTLFKLKKNKDIFWFSDKQVYSISPF